MLRYLAVLTVFVSACSGPWDIPEAHSPPPLWHSTVQARVIVVAHVDFPLNAIRDAVDRRVSTTVAFTAHVERVLKGGSVAPTIAVDYWIVPWAKDRGLTIKRLLRTREKKVVLFLNRDKGDPHYRIAGYLPEAFPIRVPGEVEAVEAEISRQQEFLSDWKPDPDLPHLATVNFLIDRALSDRSQQQNSFEQILKLGTDALPAIVQVMDDRRKLPRRSIEFKDVDSNGWVFRRAYMPETILDAMSIILTEMTGYYFGDLYSGGTEIQRQKTVEGWRILVDRCGCRPECLGPQ